MQDQDFKLVEEAQRGSADAFGQLYQKYLSPIYRYTYRQIRNSDDAKDLTQNVFVEMAKSLKTFAGKSSFKNWLYTIAKNQINKWLRLKYQLPTITLPDQLFQSLPSPSASTPRSSGSKRKKIKQFLAKLTPKEQQVVAFRYLKGLSIQETASKLQLSASHVKVLAHRAIKKLQRSSL